MLVTAIPPQPATKSVSSDVFDISGASVFNGAMILNSGSITGTFSAEVNNEVPPYGASPGTGWAPPDADWIPHPNGEITPAGGSPSSGPLTVDVTTGGAWYLQGSAAGWKWLRLKWTYGDSGAGVVSASLFTQDLANATG